MAGLLDLLLQVFDLTQAAVLHRLRLPTLPTERLQEVLTQVGGVALTLWQHGPQAAWQAIREQAQGLRAQALDFVQQQVLGVAARAVPVFLATLAVPGGAFVQVARGIYNGVMTFVEKGKQLAQVGSALLGSVSAIAAGQLAPAAMAVENTLVKVLPVALSFLAKWLGLDGISGAIQTGLRKVQAPVEKAVTKVLDTVVDKAKAVWGAVKGGAGKVVDKGRQVAAAVGQKVKGWLGFRKEFTLPNHEKHTLFFRQDGQLMLASDPTPYLDFLARQDRLSKVPATDAEHIKAHALADEIRVLATTRKALNEAHGLHLQQEKARLQGAVTTAHQDQTRELTQNAADLDAKMVELGQVTMLLLQAQHSDKQPPRANHAVWAEPRVIAPASGRRQAQVYGTGVLMEYFTTQPIAAGSSRLVTTGREPSAAVNAEFGDINLRRNGASAYYVKGHLLSQQLHGPGDWKNLTPLSRAGNAEHEDKVEALVKKVAAKSTYDPTRWKPGDPATARYAPAAAYYYSVVPQYGRPLRQDLWDQSAGNDPLQRIIQAEQGVPRSLVCILWEVDRVTGQKIKEEAAFTVNNPVEQGGLFDYQTEEIKVMLKLRAVSGSADLRPLFGQATAEAIWEVIASLPLPGQAITQSELLNQLTQHNNQSRRFSAGELAQLSNTFTLQVKRGLLSFA